MPWAPIDRADGYVHLSAESQVLATADRHFVGQTGLVLVEIDASRLTPGTLRWEPSRGGDLFPHVYGDIPPSAASASWSFPGGPEGFGWPAGGPEAERKS